MPTYRVFAHIPDIEVLVEADSEEEARHTVLETGACLHEVASKNTSEHGTVSLTTYDTIVVDSVVEEEE